MGYLGNVRPTIALVADDITDGAVTTAKIGDDAVTSAKIADADLTLTSGDFIFATAGKGICLGATSNTDANTLDDFEEGTWTASLQGTTTNPSTIPTVTAYYIKIGTYVHLACDFDNVDTTGAVGMPIIYGVPFAPVNPPLRFCAGQCMTYGSRFTWSGTPVAYIPSTYIGIYQTVSGGSWGGAAHSAGTGAYLYVTASYRSSS